ncbi:heparinase II/III domain-containing protein [Persicitalea jodogahamensis]|uniref:Heparinase n=1 Tax=Persicitalea jodogahamensis TaxID=402147 RepID=A0A8J3GAC1_9BACT|nr:heparinase II/III family protein [Persicitalea jodogahamensis]GHB71739.1 hypothetical protein GCM10007390_27030 [Persicitalea jodogahamensis]
MPDNETFTGKLTKLKRPHPRLLLLKGDEQFLVQKIQSDKSLKNIHDAILAEGNRLINQPPVERIQIGRRLLDKSREALRRIFQLSYAYRTTGEKKYLQRAEKEMLAVANFSNWNPSHFLDVAEMTMAVAIGYDWLYDDLSEGSRQKIREAILKKGIEPSYKKEYNWFLTAEHNWNQVCNAGMTFGALAIAEHEPELAERTIERALESIPKSMEPYGPDGAYPEGFGYWEYGTSFNVLFLSALERALGTDFGLAQTPGFLKTAGFEQNIVGPLGIVHNWGDSGDRNGVSPALFWFANKNNDPSLLYMQKKVIQEQPGRDLVKDRTLPALLLWGAGMNLSDIPPPKENFWMGQGPSPVAMMRSSWTDPNAFFVGFKAGSASVNHAHMDAGSFVLDALGERWAMDFGPQNYNSLEERGIKLFGREQDAERWDIFRYNNLVHNTLTIDGQYQRVKGYAKIDAFSSDPRDMAIVSDLSTIYDGQASAVKRGIALRDSRQVIVRDEVKAPDKDITLRWTLLTPAQVLIQDGSTVVLSQKGKTMYLTFNASTPLKIKTWSTEPTHDYDAPNPGTTMVGFEATLRAGSPHSFDATFSADKNTNTSSAGPISGWKVKSTK